jgi:hypothetical protein
VFVLCCVHRVKEYLFFLNSVSSSVQPLCDGSYVCSVLYSAILLCCVPLHYYHRNYRTMVAFLLKRSSTLLLMFGGFTISIIFVQESQSPLCVARCKGGHISPPVEERAHEGLLLGWY